VQRMAAMCHVSQDLLTSVPCVFRRNGANLTQDDSTIAPEACVVRSHAARLYPQREAGQSAIVDFEWLPPRLSLIAGKAWHPGLRPWMSWD